MNHPFTSSEADRSLCVKCHRNAISHTKFATCELCGTRGECDIFDDKLLCENCQSSTIDTVRESTIDIAETIDETLSNGAKVDSNIRWSGDLFNAETLAHIEIKKAILQDNGIPAEKKDYEFQRKIVERRENMQKVLWDANEIAHKTSMAILGIDKTLRDLGNQLREEFRAKIKESDSLYSVQTPSVKPKVKKIATSPYDRIIEQIMVKDNISREDAKRKFINAQRALGIDVNLES